MDEEWKRELGNGRWDKILKRKMTELSVSDDYNEAKHEWVATGNVWWRGCGETRPHWAMEHPDQCLCSHNIVYHFEIHNTENHIRECVGSDHINSYLIIRAIEEEQNISRDAITEEMIEEWVKVNVSTMKKNAWWNNNGKRFESMFNEVKDLDLRVNVRAKGNYYDPKVKKHIPKTVIRKSSSGQYGSALYKMGSIVWRWNHPDNPKAQIHSRGYPTEKLMNDLSLFFALLQQHKDKTEAEDKEYQDRVIEVQEQVALLKEQNVANQRRIAENRVLAEDMRTNTEDAEFVENCKMHGLLPFSEESASNDWERKFLRSVRNWILTGKEPTAAQVATLEKIINSERDFVSATDKQCAFLLKLGFDGDISKLSKRQASTEIDNLLKERED
tara:strand:+ start:12806 stop:13966 length:1161 start_codon:yes stop_codon:yes gene_type:complete